MDNLKMNNLMAERPIQGRDLMSEEFAKLPADQRERLICSALAGVLEQNARMRSDLAKCCDVLAGHVHADDGKVLIAAFNGLR